jgi:hypothetical protein
MGEHDRTLGDQPRKSVALLLERALAEILASRIKRSKAMRQARAPSALVHRAAKSECSINPERDRLAVDHGVLGGQLADRLRDPRKPVGEIRPVAGPQRDPLALLSAKEPVAVVLDLVQPTGSDGRRGEAATGG